MTALAGGMYPTPEKMTGKLMYLTMLFGHLSETAYVAQVRSAPMRKK